MKFSSHPYCSFIINQRFLRRKFFFILIAIVTLFLIIIAGSRTIGVDNDSFMYASVIDEFDVLTGFEPGFRFIVFLNDSLGGNTQCFFYLYAMFAIVIKVYGISKVSPDFFISLILYIGFYFILHEMMQIRIGLASGFIFFSFLFLVRQDIKNFVVVSALAVIFHYSTIITFAFLFVKPKRKIRIYYLFLPILGIAINYFLNNHFFVVKNIFELLPTFISDKALLYLESQADGGLEHTKSIAYSLNSFLYYVLFIFMYFRIKDRKILSLYDIALNSLLKIISIQFLLGFILMFNIEFSNRIFSYLGVLTFIILPAFFLKEFSVKSRIYIFAFITLYSLKMLYTNYIFILN